MKECNSHKSHFFNRIFCDKLWWLPRLPRLACCALYYLSRFVSISSHALMITSSTSTFAFINLYHLSCSVTISLPLFSLFLFVRLFSCSIPTLCLPFISVRRCHFLFNIVYGNDRNKIIATACNSKEKLFDVYLSLSLSLLLHQTFFLFTSVTRCDKFSSTGQTF